MALLQVPVAEGQPDMPGPAAGYYVEDNDEQEEEGAAVQEQVNAADTYNTAYSTLLLRPMRRVHSSLCLAISGYSIRHSVCNSQHGLRLRLCIKTCLNSWTLQYFCCYIFHHTW